MENARERAYQFLAASGSPSPGGALASELGYGVLRHRSRLDWIIEHLTERKKSSLSPEVLTILRLGVYQILFTASVPAYAAVSESVQLAKSRAPKAAGFVNWALRRVKPSTGELPRRSDIADPVRWASTFHSFPPWMVQRWRKRFGESETQRLLVAMNTFPPLDLRVNTLRAGVEDVTEELRAAGAEVDPGSYSPVALHLRAHRRLTDLPAFQEGRVYIQDQSSQLVSLLLSPEPGERVLDACAGVGGKASHLAETARDRGEVTAVDPDEGRLRLLGENVRRLGITSITPHREDILSPGFSPAAPFDKVLVDAPCSSTGIIRRHPEQKWEKREDDIGRFAKLQFRLLEGAARFLAPRGILAYSTCTIEPEENGEVVRRFIRRHRAFEIVPPPAGPVRNLRELTTPEGCVETFPHRHGMNGGFVALLRRTG
jgi:16S rRNA (cytosine967-C5)-methyltransferase